LADAEEVGTLGVVHLKRLWSRTLRGRAGLAPSTDELREWDRDDLVVMGLGLNLRETFDRLHHGAPAFAAFEAWVAQRAGDALAPAHRARLNAALRGEPVAAGGPPPPRPPGGGPPPPGGGARPGAPPPPLGVVLCPDQGAFRSVTVVPVARVTGIAGVPGVTRSACGA